MQADEVDAPASLSHEPRTAEASNWNVAHPPSPGRAVTIDTNSGTWMSVDVSPDGREIAFDLLGDIYVMPIAGGVARPLLTGVTWDMQPRFSPNGRWISFTSDRGGGDNIWFVNRDGSDPRQVTRESWQVLNQASWSPDSEYIVAHKHLGDGAGEMWLYHRGGGGGVQLTKARTEQKDTNEPAMSPDGRYLYYSEDTTAGDKFEYSRDPNKQIYIIQRLDRKTGEIEPFLTGSGGSIRPTPSPDGKSLAFIRRERYRSVLYVLDLASNRQIRITDMLDRDMQETWANHGAYPGMAWTPDSRSLIFYGQGKIRRVDVASRAVADIPFHVRNERRLTDTVRTKVDVAPSRFEVKMIRWAEVSPRRDTVVFEALGNLWIRDVAGGPVKRLTSQSNHFEAYPSWSRDGRWIVYTTWSDTKFGTIRIVSAKGGEGRIVSAHPGHYVEPAFSPDGKAIAYRSVAEGELTSTEWRRESGIYVLPVQGGESKLVTKNGSMPHFGAASDRLFFLAVEPKRRRALKSIDIDGSDERTHLVTNAASEFAVSPDGKWVAWMEWFNAYVMPFAQSGQPIDVGPDSKALPQARITGEAGEYLHWSGDSSTLRWSLGPELFSRSLNESFAFRQGGSATSTPAPAPGINIGFSHPYDAPSGRVALTGARIITMRDNEILEDGVVIINGNRIEAVGTTATLPVPKDARRLDMKGKTIIPGLIDAHWHGSVASDEVIPQQNWKHYAGLAHGVTTVHDPANDTTEIFAASEFAKAGRIVAPRIFSTGEVLYGNLGRVLVKIDSFDDALWQLRRLKAVGAFSVKSYLQPRREQRQQIVEAARQLGMIVVTEGGSLFHQNMAQIIDGHTTIEHSLPVAAVYEDVLQLWAAAEAGYTPTIVVAFGGNWGENYWYQAANVWEDPKLARFVPRSVLDAETRRRVLVPDEELNHISVARVAKQLSDRGVSVHTGAHGEREGLGMHWEMWMLAQGGFTPMEALAAATINPARTLGFDRDIGSIAAGKLADLVVLDGNPIEDIRHSASIRYTIANGRVFDYDMNEIGNESRQRQRFWFEPVHP